MGSLESSECESGESIMMSPPPGCILLDVEGDDFPTIVREIVTSLVAMGMLPEECVEPVTQVLYMRHRHASNITLWDKLKKAAHRGEACCPMALHPGSCSSPPPPPPPAWVWGSATAFISVQDCHRNVPDKLANLLLCL